MSNYMYPRGPMNRGGRGGSRVAPHPQTYLPMGWQAAYTANGDLYYVDHNTRTTHWEIPRDLLESMNHNFRGGRARRGIDRSKLKTKMCMNYQNGHCTWGENCAFAHSPLELTAPANPSERNYYKMNHNQHFSPNPGNQLYRSNRGVAPSGAPQNTPGTKDYAAPNATPNTAASATTTTNTTAPATTTAPVDATEATPATTAATATTDATPASTETSSSPSAGATATSTAATGADTTAQTAAGADAPAATASAPDVAATNTTETATASGPSKQD